MIKTLLIAALVVLGLIYGSGSDLAAVKRAVLGATKESARGVTGNDSNGWGAGTTR